MTKYKFGSLFPRKADGTPNIVYSNSLELTGSGKNLTIKSKDRAGKKQNHLLETDLEITTDPVEIPGVNNFLSKWFIPQITSIYTDDPDSKVQDDDAALEEIGVEADFATSGPDTEETVGNVAPGGGGGRVRGSGGGGEGGGGGGGGGGGTSSYGIDPNIDISSIFGGVVSRANTKWTRTQRNQTMKSLKMLGYKGPGFKNYAKNDDYWNSDGASTDDDLLTAINILSNYDPEAIWGKYNPEGPNANVISSNFDTDALLQNINGVANPDLWYPSLLYTYGVKGEGTSYPGPVLMVEPGDQVRLNFSNDIRIADLNDKQTEQATLVQNSTPGNTASDGLGGTTSTNFHLHGSHTNPGGFGDNVISRFTTGQDWTTIIDLPEDHGQGSYWYHPHYHPSVNQQVYGGLTGFMQIGDPLSNIPAFKDVPRNLALMKTMDLGVNSENGDLLLAGFDGPTPP